MTGTKTKWMLADDFAGAMDAGMQLLGIQQEIPVILHAKHIPKKALDDWSVINTNTRNISASKARILYNDLSDILREHGRPAYVKIDSTLRGNIGAALEALLQTGNGQALVAPALPGENRVTVHGIHYVDRQPLSQHEISKDPFSPVVYDRVEDIIHQQTDLPVSPLDLDLIRRSGTDELRRRILSAEKVIVADSETEDDLRKLAQMLQGLPEMIPFGSAGLIHAVQDQIPSENVRRIPVSGPLLILRGSPAKISRQQLDSARKNFPDLLFRHICPYQEDELTRKKVIQDILKALSSGRSVAIDAAADSKTEIQPVPGREEELYLRQEKIQQFLNGAAEEACRSGLIRTMMILGGDTAYGILTSLGATWIRLSGAALPLIPCGRIMDGTAKGICLITKAGGFGRIDAISRILAAVYGIA